MQQNKIEPNQVIADLKHGRTVTNQTFSPLLRGLTGWS